MSAKRMRIDAKDSDIPKDLRMCLDFLENTKRLPMEVKEKLNEFVGKSKELLQDHYKDKTCVMKDHIKSVVYLQINFFLSLLHNILHTLYKDNLMTVAQSQESGKTKIYILMYELFKLDNIEVKIQRVNKKAIKRLIQYGYNIENLPKLNTVDERVLVYFKCTAIVPPELSCYFKLKSIDAVAVNRFVRLETIEKLFPVHYRNLMETEDEILFPESKKLFESNIESIQTSFNKIVLDLIYKSRLEDEFWGTVGVLNPNFWTGIQNKPTHPFSTDNTTILDMFLDPIDDNVSLDTLLFKDHGKAKSSDVMEDIKDILCLDDVLPMRDTFLFIHSKGWMHFKSTDIETDRKMLTFIDVDDSRFFDVNVIQGVDIEENQTIYTYRNKKYYIPSSEHCFIPDIELKYVPKNDPEVYLFRTKLTLIRKQCLQNGIDVDEPPHDILLNSNSSCEIEQHSISTDDDEEKCTVCFLPVKKCLSTRWICLDCKDKYMHHFCGTKARSKNTINVPCPFCRGPLPSFKAEIYSTNIL